MGKQLEANLEIETRGSVLVARIDGGPLGLFGAAMAEKIDGLHVESAQFVTTVLSNTGQELMLDYMDNTDEAGELPLYIQGVYDQVPEAGNSRGAGAPVPVGAVRK